MTHKQFVSAHKQMFAKMRERLNYEMRANWHNAEANMGFLWDRFQSLHKQEQMFAKKSRSLYRLYLKGDYKI